MSKAKKKYVFDSRSQRKRGTVFSVLEPTQPKMPNNGTAPLPLDLVQCKICIRRFFPEDREKHEEICQKLLAKRRKVFDSRRQRTGGTEIFQKPTQPKPSIWRKKYEDFMASRAHHQERAAMKDGTSLPPPPPHPYDPDYIQCPYCQWRFKKSAADRHIQICKEQHAQIALSWISTGCVSAPKLLSCVTSAQSAVHQSPPPPVLLSICCSKDS
uniref:Zinc finger C2HC domain-containing protein 1A n=1 Tax=Gouania willdenowi TaxID=441366 RepID=A0A8C5DHK5_GOUWI